MIIFTDRVIEKIDEFIGRYPAERGGALMALPNSNIVAAFLSDPAGEMTSASYVPSRALSALVQRQEREQGLAFCGVIHSHPTGFDEPSSQDDVAFRKGLDINPHLARFIAPIVTHDRPARRGVPHEAGIGAGARMSCYVAFRAIEARMHNQLFSNDQRANTSVGARDIPLSRSAPEPWETYGPDGRLSRPEPQIHPTVRSEASDPADHTVLRERVDLVRLVRTPVQVMSLQSQIDAVELALQRRFKAPTETAPGPIVNLGGIACFSETIRYPGGDLTIILPPTFPFTPPIVIQGAGDLSRELQLEWNMEDGLQADSLARRLLESKIVKASGW